MLVRRLLAVGDGTGTSEIVSHLVLDGQRLGICHGEGLERRRVARGWGGERVSDRDPISLLGYATRASSMPVKSSSARSPLEALSGMKCRGKVLNLLESDGQSAVVSSEERRGNWALQDGKEIQLGEVAACASLVRRDRGIATPALVQAVEDRLGIVEGQPCGLGAAVHRLGDDGQRRALQLECGEGVVIVRGREEDIRGRRARQSES